MPYIPAEPSKEPWTKAQRARYTGVLKNSGTVRSQRPPAPKSGFVPSTAEWTAEQRARITGILTRSGDRLLGRQRMREESAATGRMPEYQAREFLGEHYENAIAEADTMRMFHGIAGEMDSGRMEKSPENVSALLGSFQGWLDGQKPYIIPPGDLNFDAPR